ncbi:XkdQ/YqbQ family protein [Acidaminococcus intestini]|uniref:XkdQ/YqbQ family protein n=1 Tax=Acidaminococcus intestini TaxID=187327 RepID=UPI00258E456A|nr:hypothetical protein [Acidaminococcus intestini]
MAKINKADTENQQADKPQNTDLSAYVLSYTWSGDVEQAGRKLEFDIAYTTKDKNWTNAVLELGDEVCFSYTDEVTQEMFPIFQGRIFSRSRDSESYSMRFVAFDNIIYLAKSRITRKYANVTVADAIRQTIHDFNIEAGTMPDLSVVCRCRPFPWCAVSSPMTSQRPMPSSRRCLTSRHRTARGITST